MGAEFARLYVLSRGRNLWVMPGRCETDPLLYLALLEEVIQSKLEMLPVSTHSIY
jgi:hypothetical protein